MNVTTQKITLLELTEPERKMLKAFLNEMSLKENIMPPKATEAFLSLLEAKL
jgi:hypothetical protein